MKAAAVAATLTQDPGHRVEGLQLLGQPPQSQQQQQQHLHGPGNGRSVKRPLESPEMARNPEGMCDLNLSASSWSEDRELEDQCDGMGSSPTCAAAASKALTAPAATAEPAEEGEELLYQQQQTSAPWYCQFFHCSNHPLKEFCTMCLESKK